MTDLSTHAPDQEPLEGALKGEVLRMYQKVADHPEAEFHFFHGRVAAEWQWSPGFGFGNNPPRTRLRPMALKPS